ncbi:hypothetical protein Cni_G22664 [Canna indica]|uniref:RNase H type-1 domain-containing protein n=1 Tax=Canna indica TaxID=4628 RepID=A0AAQ3KS79_9LILI|nr:hypothetical protein Cni_G22664 [Canna indica]
MNCIANGNEKRGGRPFKLNQFVNDFRNFMAGTELIDDGFQGPTCTWSNMRNDERRISARLDKVLYNVKWLEANPDFKVKHLSRIEYDHRHLLVQCMHNKFRRMNAKLNRFVFEQFWLEYPNLKNVVNKHWMEESSVKTNLMEKLELLKGVLLNWNRNVVENLERKHEETSLLISKLESKEYGLISEKEKLPLRSLTQKLFALNMQIKIKGGDLCNLLQNSGGLQDKITNRGEVSVISLNLRGGQCNLPKIKWWVKAKKSWVDDSDKNTKFFHNFVLVRRKKNMVEMLEADDRSITDEMDIVKYFENWYSSLWKVEEDKACLENQLKVVFIPKRHIQDNILMVAEIISSFHHSKAKEPFILIKCKVKSSQAKAIQNCVSDLKEGFRVRIVKGADIDLWNDTWLDNKTSAVIKPDEDCSRLGQIGYWLKVDGAWKGGLNVGCGFVVEKSDRILLFGQDLELVDCPLYAELKVIWFGLDNVRKKEMKNILVLSDCSTAINIMNGVEVIPWDMKVLVERIKLIAEEIYIIEWRFIRREENTIADTLAKEALELEINRNVMDIMGDVKDFDPMFQNFAINKSLTVQGKILLFNLEAKEARPVGPLLLLPFS